LAFFKGILYAADRDTFLAALDPSSGTPRTWLSSGSASKDTWDIGYARAVSPLGDSLIVAGNFGTVNGVPVSNLAVFPPRAANLGAQTMNNGSLRIQINNEPGVQYILQSTTNFSSWVPIVTNSGSFYYDDTNATESPLIFYRGVTQP